MKKFVTRSLTDEQAAQILITYVKSDLSARDVGARFGVKRGVVHAIKSGQNYPRAWNIAEAWGWEIPEPDPIEL